MDDKTDITVNITYQCRDFKVDFDIFKKLVKQICTRFSVNKATIGVAIVDDDKIKKVNERFLSKTSNTDVISFDLSDGDSFDRDFELIVNAQQAGRQAQNRGHSLEAELALYITHGLLHNMGFDDTNEKNAKKMHDMEDKILQKAGFGIIYANKSNTSE